MSNSLISGFAQGEEGAAAVPSEADQQRCLHQAEQGHHRDAEDLW